MKIKIDDLPLFKQKALAWANQFKVCCVLDSNHFKDTYSTFDFLVAANSIDEIEIFESSNTYETLSNFKKKHQGWVFGGFSYDLKNQSEDLYSHHADSIGFPEAFFFSPEHTLILKDDELEIFSPKAEEIFQEILAKEINVEELSFNGEIKSKVSKSSYIQQFDKILAHIKRGDIYIANFCIEFFAENVDLHPALAYYLLNQLSPAPFSSFLKWKDSYALTCSPERFLAKRNHKIISQPIKGTAKRSANPHQDLINKNALKHSLKEQQENVMIVDLVRNDLTKTAKKGSVKVEELFGVYSFEQVHQMISTIVCEVDHEINPIQLIKNTFPMGSMTGAPKLSAMQIIEDTENSKRGIYSGAIGYFSPDGDFDFNVVIRSVQYNAHHKYLSFMVGSAITYHALAENEYAECLLKAEAIFKLFGYKA